MYSGTTINDQLHVYKEQCTMLTTMQELDQVSIETTMTSM